MHRSYARVNTCMPWEGRGLLTGPCIGTRFMPCSVIADGLPHVLHTRNLETWVVEWLYSRMDSNSDGCGRNHLHTLLLCCI